MGVKEKLQICILVFALVALTPELISLCYERVNWQEYSDKGRQLVTFGDSKEAVKYFESEAREIFKKEGVKSPRYIACLEGQSLAFQKEKLFISAEEKLNEARIILDNNLFKDRQKLSYILGMKAQLLKDQGLNERAREVEKDIQGYNAWWHWFWTGFFIAFVTEALYMANVLGRPGNMELHHLKVDHGSLYGFSIVVGTATMTKGLLMCGMPFLQAIFAGPGISLALLPLVFGLVMASSEHFVREDPLNHLKPSRQAGQS